MDGRITYLNPVASPRYGQRPVRAGRASLGSAVHFLRMNCALAILTALLWAAAAPVVARAQTGGRWTSMDYRAPGLVHTDTNNPTTNTDYSVIWRYIRQMRSEAVHFAEVTHQTGGMHQTGSILGIHIADHALTNGQYNPQDWYYPGLSTTQWMTNLVAQWTNSCVANSAGDGTTLQSVGEPLFWHLTTQETAPVVDPDNPGSGYQTTDYVTLVGGDPISPAICQVVADEMGAVTAVYAIEGGQYLTEQTGSMETTGGNGTGLRVMVTSGFQTFSTFGVFSNLSVGQPIRVDDGTTTTWTGLVASIRSSGKFLTTDPSMPFTTETGLVLSVISSMTTNLMPHATWSVNDATTPIAYDYHLDMLSSNEVTVIIGPNGLKLWIKVLTWYSIYNTWDWNIGWTGPNVDVQPLVPPFTNILALVCKPYGGSQMYISRGDVESHWVDGSERMMFPTTATAMGWPASFNVRQFYGQPAATFGLPGWSTLEGTGGVVCIAIGR